MHSLKKRIRQTLSPILYIFKTPKEENVVSRFKREVLEIGIEKKWWSLVLNFLEVVNNNFFVIR
jgi:hypothetical protein